MDVSGSCFCFLPLNTATMEDFFPSPSVEYSIDALSGSKSMVSILDFSFGHWQVVIDPTIAGNATFVTSSSLNV